MRRCDMCRLTFPIDQIEGYTCTDCRNLSKSLEKLHDKFRSEECPVDQEHKQQLIEKYRKLIDSNQSIFE